MLYTFRPAGAIREVGLPYFYTPFAPLGLLVFALGIFFLKLRLWENSQENMKLLEIQRETKINCPNFTPCVS